MLEIRTSALKSRKKVPIDGHVYIVRTLGAGEQLEINQLIREAKKLEEQVKGKEATPAQEKQGEVIAQKLLDSFTALFDDQGDQSKSRALVNSLTEVELIQLLKQIFTPEDLIDESETTS